MGLALAPPSSLVQSGQPSSMVSAATFVLVVPPVPVSVPVSVPRLCMCMCVLAFVLVFVHLQLDSVSSRGE